MADSALTTGLDRLPCAGNYLHDHVWYPCIYCLLTVFSVLSAPP